MTFEGTNTWILGSDGADRCIVVDPGSQDPTHLDTIAGWSEARGWLITSILLTHGHADHADGSRELSHRTGAPIRAFDASVADDVLIDGEIIDNGPQPVTVLHTPGHSDDSVSLWLERDGSVLTGDTILGGHSSGVFGDLASFFESLARLRSIAERHPGLRFLPGHGQIVEDPIAIIDQVELARRSRLAQVEQLVDAGGSTTDYIVDILYPHLHGHSRFPARFTVASYLNYLHREPATEKGN